MRLLAGWAVGCCAVLAATAACAQGAGPYYGSPYADGPYPPPYGAMLPPGALGRGDVPILPSREVYEVLRETGFAPTGVPHLRGFTYVVMAVNRRGDDGRVVIDARSGQVISFTPAYRLGDDYEEGINDGGPRGPYGPNGPRGAVPPSPPPPMPTTSNAPRPPAAVPRVATRVVPQPVPRPAAVAPQVAARPEAAPPAPAQQSAAPMPKPAPVTAAAAPPPAAPTVGQAKSAPQILSPQVVSPQVLPTQPMPEAQGLEY